MGLASGLRLVPTRLYGRHLQLVATNLQLCSEILIQMCEFLAALVIQCGIDDF